MVSPYSPNTQLFGCSFEVPMECSRVILYNAAMSKESARGAAPLFLRGGDCVSDAFMDEDTTVVEIPYVSASLNAWSATDE